MKIKEIITEAPANYNSSAYTNSPIWNTMGPTATTPNGSQLPLWPSSSHAARTGSTTSASAQSAARRQRAADMRLRKNAGEAADKVKRFLASDRYQPYLNDKRKWLSNGAKYLRIWQFLGFGQLIASYYDAIAALQVMKDLPKDDPNHISQDEYDKYWWQQGEVLVLQILASEALPRLIQGMKLSKWVISIIGGLGTTASFGATLAIFVASEVAMGAFIQLLLSPKGKEWLARLVAYCIDPLARWMWAAGPGKLIDFIKGEVGKEDNKDKDKPSDKPSSDNKPSNQAAQPDKPSASSTILTPNVPQSGYQGNPDDMMKKPAKLPFS